MCLLESDVCSVTLPIPCCTEWYRYHPKLFSFLHLLYSSFFSPPQTLFFMSITPALLFSPLPPIRHHWLPVPVSHHFGHSLCCGLLPHLLPLHFLNVNADCSHDLDSSCTDCYQPLLTHDWCCIGPIDDWYQYRTEILILVVGISFVFIFYFEWPLFLFHYMTLCMEPHIGRSLVH